MKLFTFAVAALFVATCVSNSSRLYESFKEWKSFDDYSECKFDVRIEHVVNCKHYTKDLCSDGKTKFCDFDFKNNNPNCMVAHLDATFTNSSIPPSIGFRKVIEVYHGIYPFRTLRTSTFMCNPNTRDYKFVYEFAPYQKKAFMVLLTHLLLNFASIAGIIALFVC